jgi:hypothetical protein
MTEYEVTENTRVGDVVHPTFRALLWKNPRSRDEDPCRSWTRWEALGTVLEITVEDSGPVSRPVVWARVLIGDESLWCLDRQLEVVCAG